MNGPTAQPPRLLLRPVEAADVLSISRTTLYGLLQTGALRSVKVGGLRRIPYEALEEFVGQLCAGREAEAGAPWAVDPEGEGSVPKRAGQPAGAGRLAPSDRTTSPSSRRAGHGFARSPATGHGTVAP